MEKKSKIKEKKLKSEKEHKDFKIEYGSIIFGVGVLIAFVSAFIKIDNNAATKITLVTLMLCGIIVGLLNIKEDEIVKFLISCIALVLLIGPFLGMINQYFLLNQSTIPNLIFVNIISLIVPAAIIVALKAVFYTAKD